MKVPIKLEAQSRRRRGVERSVGQRDGVAGDKGRESRRGPVGFYWLLANQPCDISPTYNDPIRTDVTETRKSTRSGVRSQVRSEVGCGAPFVLSLQSVSRIHKRFNAAIA